jgi:hypothetical protein
MTSRVRSTVVLVAAAVTLAGCSLLPGAPTVDPAPSTTSAPPSSVAPATGATITGDGYSYQVPEGWDVPEAPVPGFDPDSIALDHTDDDGFSDNVNVILSPAGAITADQVESIGVSELEGVGATEVQVNDRISVAGAESAHLSALLSSNGTGYQIEQYYPTNAGQTYVVTFSFSETVTQTDRVALAESVLASWVWA